MNCSSKLLRLHLKIFLVTTARRCLKFRFVVEFIFQILEGRRDIQFYFEGRQYLLGVFRLIYRSLIINNIYRIFSMPGNFDRVPLFVCSPFSQIIPLNRVDFVFQYFLLDGWVCGLCIYCSVSVSYVWLQKWHYFLC